MAEGRDAVPNEFTEKYIRANSSYENWLFKDVYQSQEPARSLRRLGLTFRPDKTTPTHLNFNDESHYYNVGEGTKAHAYWSGMELPKLTKDINQLRQDLKEWGYCLVEEALSAPQLAAMQKRLIEQAKGEQAAGIALWLNASASGSNSQFIAGLVNKGRCFEDFLEHNPHGIQAGPLMEQLCKEGCGGEFLVTSMLAIIAGKDGFPQALHQDQDMRIQSDVPVGINQMIMLVDVGPTNGGTLVVPGSHKILAAAGSGQSVEALPPPINITAPAGSVLMWDSRLLHGAGVNRTDEPRYCVVAQSQRPCFRQQENFALSVSPEVLSRASDKMLYRMGLQGSTGCTVEGDDLSAPGRIGDEFGSLKKYRKAMDRGEYLRVGELSPDMPEEQLMAPFTIRTTATGRRAVNKAKKFGLLTTERLAEVTALATEGQDVDKLTYIKRGSGSNTISNSTLPKPSSKL